MHHLRVGALDAMGLSSGGRYAELCRKGLQGIQKNGLRR